MMVSKEVLEYWATAVGMISAPIALVTFILSQWSAYQSRRKDEVRQWRKTAAVNALRGAAGGGMTLEQIRSSLLNVAVNFEKYHLRNSDLNDAAMERVLLELLSDGVIKQVGPGRYVLTLIGEDPMRVHMVAMVQEQSEDVRSQNELIRILAQNPGKYARGELVGILVQAGIAPARASGIVANFISRGVIFVDRANGYKTLLATDAPEWSFGEEVPEQQ